MRILSLSLSTAFALQLHSPLPLPEKSGSLVQVRAEGSGSDTESLVAVSPACAAPTPAPPAVQPQPQPADVSSHRATVSVKTTIQMNDWPNVFAGAEKKVMTYPLTSYLGNTFVLKMSWGGDGLSANAVFEQPKRLSLGLNNPTHLSVELENLALHVVSSEDHFNETNRSFKKQYVFKHHVFPAETVLVRDWIFEIIQILSYWYLIFQFSILIHWSRNCVRVARWALSRSTTIHGPTAKAMEVGVRFSISKILNLAWLYLLFMQVDTVIFQCISKTFLQLQTLKRCRCSCRAHD